MQDCCPQEMIIIPSSLDFTNTAPQVLVLLPQVASVSLSSSPDITHTLGKLMVSPPPPPATASSVKAACWVYLHHQWELILAASRLQFPGHQLPRLADIWKNNLCIPLLQHCFWLLSPLFRNWPAAIIRVRNHSQKDRQSKQKSDAERLCMYSNHILPCLLRNIKWPEHL